ncbi:hypothetical protein ACP70R_037627 [Stipagrostis hirtigluma subsp. patula]
MAAVGEASEAADGVEDDRDEERRLGEYDIPVQVSWEGEPATAAGFDATGVAESLLRGLARRGHESPTPLQRNATPIPIAVAGEREGHRGVRGGGLMEGGCVLRRPSGGERAVGSLQRLHSSSFQSAARVYLFIITVLLLIPRSDQFPISDNTTDTCPAPYLQFKRPVPNYGALLFETLDPGFQLLLKLKSECPSPSFDVELVSKGGAIISLLANFAPLFPAIASDISPRRILLIGTSCLFFAEANLSWMFHLHAEECAHDLALILAIIACVWNFCYALRFWWRTSLSVKRLMLIVLLCAFLGLLAFAYPNTAGVFGLIFTSCDHVIRIISGLSDAQQFNKITLLFAFVGGLGSGSVFYKPHFKTITIFKVGSMVSFGARAVEFFLQIFLCCHGRQIDTNNLLRIPLLVKKNEAMDGQNSDPNVNEQNEDGELVPHENEHSEHCRQSESGNESEASVPHEKEHCDEEDEHSLPLLADATHGQHVRVASRLSELKHEKSEAFPEDEEREELQEGGQIGLDADATIGGTGHGVTDAGMKTEWDNRHSKFVQPQTDQLIEPADGHAEP